MVLCLMLKSLSQKMENFNIIIRLCVSGGIRVICNLLVCLFLFKESVKIML